MTGGAKRCFESRKIPEHAQEPLDVVTHCHIPTVSDWRFLTLQTNQPRISGFANKVANSGFYKILMFLD